ncbi:MAG TPA: thioredoxin family protein [Pirellulales bacterium]|nr:thioredoxin family protein [Pirellulales bacterium]
MTSFALSAALQLSLLSAGANTYAEAHKDHSETGRPMVILVGAEWCPACVQMKNTVLPQVARRGVLQKVAFATVNADNQRSLAQKLMKGGSIPQLIMYRRSGNGWKRHLLVGKHSPERIEAFINQGLVAEEPANPTVTPVSQPMAGGEAKAQANQDNSPKSGG